LDIFQEPLIFLFLYLWLEFSFPWLNQSKACVLCLSWS